MNDKMILLWVGDKTCTFGNANKKTGKLSYHGEFKRFKSKADRKQWLNNANFNGYENAYICNEITGRKYDLGCDLSFYYESLKELDYEIINNE